MGKKTAVLIGFILLKFVLQYTLVSDEYQLQRDEYMHLDQAHHLAWGYLSVPPVTSWISWLIYQLGNGLFWVKFFPALFGVATMVVVWKTIEMLKGNWFALVLGAVAILFSAILRVNILYQPNSLDILAWTLLYFTLLKYFHSGNTKWLWWAALVFIIGFLNKYNIAFLVLGIFPALLLTPQRKILAKKQLYLAIGIALLGIAPNLIWQYNNNFPVIHHMDELARTQLVNVSIGGFLKEQVLFFFGAIFVVIAGLGSLFFYKPFAKYRFVGWSFLFTMLLFIWFHAKGYYAIGLYPILLAFGAVYLEKSLENGWKRHLRPVAIALPVLLFVPVIKIAFPIDSPQEIRQNGKRYKDLGLLRWEDGKDHELPQDFADMIGWKEMAAAVDSAYATIPDKTHTLILCDNYGQAGAINYYTKFPNLRAVSFHADYINWFPLDTKFRNVIAVKELDDDDPKRTRETPLFESVMLVDSIRNPLAREYRTKVFVYLGAKVDVNKRITDEIARKKNFEE